MRSKLFASCGAALAFAIVVAFGLSGCSAAAPSKPAEEPPPQPAPPTLLGTWQRVSTDRDNDGNTVRTETNQLTFTATHYIERNLAEYANRVAFDSGHRVGTYTATETSVTKTYSRYVDDEEPTAEEVSVNKDYLFVGDSLFIHHWGSDDPELGFDRFTRLEDPPMQGAPSTLRGTWQRVDFYDHDDFGRVKETYVLTLTATRFIQINVITDVTTDDLRDDWHDQGTWNATETSFTKTFIPHGEEISVDKKYVLAGDLLAIEPWWSDEPRIDFDVYTRVRDPLPGGLAGVWEYETTWDDHPRFGVVDQHWTFTFGEGDSFTEVYRETKSGTSDSRVFTITGSRRHDHEKYFMFVTVGSGTALGYDGTQRVLGEPWVGHTLRYAYAPAGTAGRLLVSTRSSELVFDDATAMWIDDPDHPYGDYWMRLER